MNPTKIPYDNSHKPAISKGLVEDRYTVDPLKTANHALAQQHSLLKSNPYSLPFYHNNKRAQNNNVHFGVKYLRAPQVYDKPAPLVYQPESFDPVPFDNTYSLEGNLKSATFPNEYPFVNFTPIKRSLQP